MWSCDSAHARTVDIAIDGLLLWLCGAFDWMGTWKNMVMGAMGVVLSVVIVWHTCSSLRNRGSSGRVRRIHNAACVFPGKRVLTASCSPARSRACLR